MDIKIIKSIINLFESSKLSELEMEENNDGKSFKIRMGRADKAVTVATTQANVPLKPVFAQENIEGVLDYNRVDDVKSPMVGVFYSSSSPETTEFVQKGSKVHKGDTLCIIEAMKLMNEVLADRDGEIVEVLARSGELVEFGQTLFRIF